jgi:RNA polymerase sigma factor (sigma-70 family)
VDTTDNKLIQQLLSPLAGLSQKGWQDVYKNCFPVVRAVVLKHNGSEQDAIDIFQDGLLVFNRNLKNGKFRGDSSVRTYIFSICKNLWLKEFQKKQKQATIDPYLLNDETTDDFNYLKNIEVVTQLMSELQEDCRKILIEYYYNNKSMIELKDIFNVNSVQAAKNKKWRCLGYLVKLFKEKGITSMQMVDHE